MGSSGKLRSSTSSSVDNTSNSNSVNNANSSAIKSINTQQRGGISESSTTSDNTTDFIAIVKKHEIVYNTHHPYYKNGEIKLQVWTQIAEEIGLSVEASKRKWKNLRDSYTKYLRSFRVGTKTSKKYQFWAHAEHMDFLKPFQGPGRSSTNAGAAKDEEDNESDLGSQAAAIVTANAVDDVEIKYNPTAANNTLKNVPTNAATIGNTLPSYASNASGSLKTPGIGLTCSGAGSPAITSSVSGTIMLPVPSLPTVQLPPSLTAKPILANITSSQITSSSASSIVSTISSTSNSYNPTASLASLTTTSLPSQVFALPPLSTKGSIPMPSSNTASSVGCLIIEPQLFASADTFKKEFNNSSSIYSSSSSAQIASSGLQIYPNVGAHMPTTSQTMSSRLNAPLITKVRRVQPSPQSSAINLTFPPVISPSVTTASTSFASYQTNGYSLPNSFIPTIGGSTTITATAGGGGGGGGGQPAAKKLKTAEVDIAAILHANRDLDANTLFFLSLARSVRFMPTKFQSLAKMRCMRIVSDIELDLDNANNDVSNSLNTKYCTNDTDSPPTAGVSNVSEAQQSEHFVYAMSPSRVEGMIDLSSDEESPSTNAN